MPPIAAAAVAVAYALDRAVAEPPARLHPVAWYGRLLAPFDREWSHPRLVGLVPALAFPVGAAVAAAGTVDLAARAGPLSAGLAAGGVLFVATSLRMLLNVADEVTAATEPDLDAARTRLRALAGRDAAALSPGEVRSAAVESAAENLADGLVAPLFAFAALAPASLPAAAGAAAWVKAVNTADSMLGYRTKPVGWASARLDDAVMWAPARLSAALIAFASADPAALARARRWASAPPSPNSGWPMATLAAALGVRLRKPGVYDVDPYNTTTDESGVHVADGRGRAAREPVDGPSASERLPSTDQARRGVRVVGRAGVVAVLVAGVVAWL